MTRKSPPASYGEPYMTWLTENVHRGVILSGRALTEQEAQRLLKNATEAVPDMEFVVVEPPA